MLLFSKCCSRNMLKLVYVHDKIQMLVVSQLHHDMMASCHGDIHTSCHERSVSSFSNVCFQQRIRPMKPKDSIKNSIFQYGREWSSAMDWLLLYFFIQFMKRSNNVEICHSSVIICILRAKITLDRFSGFLLLRI